MSYNVSLPSYSVGTDVYKLVGSICAGYGHKAVAIGGHKAMAAVKDKLCKAIIDSDIEISDFIWYGGEASYENVENLMSLETVRNADMLFAIGGGKATDTVKTLADMTGKPVFTFPTIASNCSSCTSVSIMYKNNGIFLNHIFLPTHRLMHLLIQRLSLILLRDICGQESGIHTQSILKAVFPQGVKKFLIILL